MLYLRFAIRSQHLFKFGATGIFVLAILISTFARSAAQFNLLSFGYDRAIQIIDPDGLNRMPFWINGNVTNLTVDFTLYRLESPDFVRRYTTLQPYTYQPPMDVTGLPQVATWQQTLSSSTSYGELQAVALPTTTVSSGIYVIKASAPNAGQATAMLAVSRHVLLLKRGNAGQITVWATRLQNGAPSSGMTIALYNAQGESVGQGVTDGNGLVTLNVGNAQPLIAIGQLGAEIALAGLDWQWASLNTAYWPSANPAPYRIFLATDRPIYRPGQTINYNAIVRNDSTNGYTVLAATVPISVTLRDARSNVIGAQLVHADEFGAVAGSFTLGAEPPLGDYHVELTVGGQTQRQRLRVEEYRKPEYAVEVTTPADFAITGDSIPVTVAANYFFGQPVANAQVKLQIYRQPIYWYDYGWWYGHPTLPNYNGLVTELTGVTDGNGHWTTTYTPENLADYSASYSFKATVTDARNQPLSGEKDVQVYWNNVKLAVNTAQYGYQTGEPVAVNVTAQSYDTKAIAGQALTVHVVHYSWETNTETDAAPAQAITTDAQGKAQVTFTGLPQGWYQIVARGADTRGRAVEARNYLWIYDPSSNVWWYSSPEQISLTTDRNHYAPGDTAKLLIQARVNGVALLTLERAGVYTERIVNLNGPLTTVEVPITTDFAPNVFAKIHLFRPTQAADSDKRAEGQMLNAQVEISVPATDKKLNLAIAMDATAYKPGSQAVLTLHVTDAAGQPVRAQVSLALVDEAIFALQADLSGDLFDTFYGAMPNSVATYDSLVRRPYNYGPIADTGPLPMTPTAEPTTSPPDADNGATAAPRRLFLDTAFWKPDIVTGNDGVATLTVPLPANLTTWRVIALAVTVDSKVGEARTKLLVTKEIIASPTLPRFTVLGDRFSAGLVAQNFSGSATTGAANLMGDHLLVLDPLDRSLQLPDRATTAVSWTAVASQIGTGLVTSTVNTGNGQDIVELPLVTKAFAVPERWTAAGQANLIATSSFTVPFNAVNAASALTLRLSSSLALGLLDGLDELIDYPYGCVEQTMSRVLPSAVAAKAYTDLGIPNPKADKLPEIINQGLQKLYGFQHDDGSWGWFYDDDGGVYLTAYVLYGLNAVQTAGFTVDNKVLDRGFAYLNSKLDSIDQPGTKAFALYVKVIAGRGDLAQAQALLPQTAQMETDALAALAFALHLGGNENAAQTIVDQVLSRARESGSTVAWPVYTSDTSLYHWQTMSSDVKNTAFVVRLLTALRPDQPLLPKAVRWLMEHRQGAGWGGYGSGNTQATAFAVIGLAAYIKNTGELQAEYRYTVQLNGATIASGQVTPPTARQPIPLIEVAGDQLRTGENTLRIERSAGNGQLYYTALLRQQLFYDNFTAVTSVDNGLALKRSYKLVEGSPRTDGAYNVGDLVEVTLDLDVREQMAYVLIEDPLPAGFEGVIERVNPIVYGDYDWPYFWQEWGYNRKDVRDDKVDFFMTTAWPGHHALTYLMRATTPGEFSVLPGEAYPMYNEAIWGRSASQRVTVAPEQLIPRPVLSGDFDNNCLVTDFDARQVAGVYGLTAPNRNLTGDARIDLRDVAAVVKRVGASCVADRSVPDQTGNGVANFVLALPNRTVTIGERFDVPVTLATLTAAKADLSNLGGFGLTLHFDANRMALASVQWNPALGNGLPLGPTVDNVKGVVSVGTFHLPSNGAANSPLLTLTFVGWGVGAGSVTAIAAEAVDNAGRLITASAQTEGGVQVDGKQLFLPVVGR
ncbi:MAG: MG2 domain-containing protein [Caldilineaceae bacterium]